MKNPISYTSTGPVIRTWTSDAVEPHGPVCGPTGTSPARNGAERRIQESQSSIALIGAFMGTK